MKGKKIFWGLFFILSGVLVLVNQLGLFTNIGLLSLFFTIFLVAIFIESSMHLAYAGMLFSLAFLCIIYAEPLNIESITPWPVLITAFLGSIGLHCIFDSAHKHFNKEFINEEIDTDNIVSVNVSFGESAKYINAENLEKVNVTCSFGAVKVYLDKATLKDDQAIVDLNVSFSGIELYIPKEYKVINNIDTSLGGVDEKNNWHGDKTNKTIILTGKVSLAGVEIIYI